MTVKDLIIELEKCDPQAQVRIAPIEDEDAAAVVSTQQLGKNYIYITDNKGGLMSDLS